ncbi:MAG TPA: histidine kinase dimerization/phosphoacceptor domain -containing protein [Arenibaculum sp.]|nr:histidine kinase dimerization/phosphoacceptor domain -containing protein [Arenibaculum sp.]
MLRRFGSSIAAAGLLIAVLLGVAGWLSYARVAGSVEARAETVVMLMAREAERLVASADLLLERTAVLAGETDLSDPAETEQVHDALRHLQSLSPDALRLFILGPDGRVRAATTHVPAEIAATRRDYFNVHVDAGDQGLFLGKPVQALIDGRLIFVASRRVTTSGGAFGGVVSVSFEPQVLADTYQSLAFAQGASFVWARTDRQMLLRVPNASPEELLEKRLTPEFSAMVRRAPEYGRREYVSTFDGMTRMSWYRRVGRYPLYVEFGLPHDHIVRAWVGAVLPYAAVALAVMLGLAASLAYALRWGYAEERFQRELAEHARKLGEANAHLERRVAERTASLMQVLGEKEGLLAQKELLLREVNHRVANSLHLVTSLLQIQGSALPDGEARRQFDEAVSRVAAVGRLHEQLHRSERFASVDLASYLESLCADLERSARADSSDWRIAAAGDPVVVSADQAITVGMIVNELVTNAVKHARPDPGVTDGWTIDVTLRRSAGGEVWVSIRDRGPGLPVPTRSPGIGMHLLAGLVDQVEGNLTSESADPGTRFTLHFTTAPVDGPG